MALAIDASTPAIKGGSGTGSQTITSNSFSPPSGSLLLVGLCNVSGTPSAISDPTLSGGSLSYTKLISKDKGATTESYAAFYVADVPSAPGSMAVAYSTAVTGWSTAAGGEIAIAVIVLTGAAAAASQTGHTISEYGGAFSVTLASAASTSWIFGMVGDWENNDTPTVGTSQTDTFNSQGQAWTNSSQSSAGWLQGNSAAGNTNLTMNDSSPSGTKAHSVMIGVEILVSGGAPAASPPLRATNWPQGMWRSAYR